MSLKHIQQKQSQTTFGGDLSVLIADTYINGDLDIQGSINGTSSQGQNSNNIWTGTNTYSVFRPTSSLPSVGLQDGVNQTFLDNTITDEGIINAGATWSGVNTFTNDIGITDITGLIPTYIPPVNPTDAVCGKYIADSWTAEGLSYLSSNNTWSGTNTFNVLPICLDPLVATSIATKNYTDNTITSITQGKASTTASQLAIVGADWGLGCLAVSLQIIGGGAGSTSSVGTCECSSAGVSGASASQASIILLTNSIAGGGTNNNGLFDISVGYGGKAGVGCGTDSGSGSGGATNLFVTPKPALGYNPAQVNILRTNGGNGFGTATCGQAGNPSAGLYSTINPSVVAPFSYSNGKGGSQCAGLIPQYYGINQYGWGARGAGCTNGSLGGNGGYGITFFTS